jgi:hypothetical protein
VPEACRVSVSAATRNHDRHCAWIMTRLPAAFFGGSILGRAPRCTAQGRYTRRSTRRSIHFSTNPSVGPLCCKDKRPANRRHARLVSGIRHRKPGGSRRPVLRRPPDLSQTHKVRRARCSLKGIDPGLADSSD